MTVSIDVIHMRYLCIFRLRNVTINEYKLQRTYKVYTGFPGGEIRGGRYGNREKGRYVCG